MTLNNYPGNPPPTVPSAEPVNYGGKEDEITYTPEAQVFITDTVAATQTVPVAQISSTSNPPGNCPDGGQWGTVEYVGNKTTALACLGCLCFGLFGLCVLACPQDEKDAYRVHGKLYDAEGALMGPVSRYQFTPTRQRGGGTQQQQVVSGRI